MRFAILIATVFATTATGGCAGGLGGGKRYACEGLPSRPLCLATSEVYALTNRAGRPSAEVRAPRDQTPRETNR
jgi:hypothetical protein